jgi:hypothetical protein
VHGGLENGTGDGRRRRALVLERNVNIPFNPVTTFGYSLAHAGVVRLDIHDVHGRMVRVLDAGRRAPGRHPVVCDGRDARGPPVPGGVYLRHLDAGSFTR